MVILKVKPLWTEAQTNLFIEIKKPLHLERLFTESIQWV
tara:strand:+ start:510 stop:626 length:117 start_codon:yes stop_codon:yes gene_type:complete